MNLKTLAIAWTLMWGISYIIVAIVAPWIADTSPLFYVALGALILFALLLRHLAYNELGYNIVRVLFFCLGTLMVFGGVTSWTGVTLWNVPFSNVEIFQVGMAFADFIAAAFMFVLAIEK